MMQKANSHLFSLKTSQRLLPLILMTLALSSHATVVTQSPDIKLNFVTVPAGQFMMGSENLQAVIDDLPTPNAEMVNDETPAHLVTFNKSFQLSQTEVTQAIWYKIMQTKPGPDKHWKAKNWQQLPVVSISWTDTNNFIKRLNQLSTTQQYRLPTEAEWEYAARAGSTGLRPFSKLAMDEYAWYLHSSNDEIQPVGKLKANDWGLYDMYGNAWEWVADWYSPTAYKNAQKHHQQGPKQGSKKIRRGGSYHCPPHLIRPAYRAADTPNKAYSVLGFRLITEPYLE